MRQKHERNQNKKAAKASNTEIYEKNTMHTIQIQYIIMQICDKRDSQEKGKSNEQKQTEI